MSVSKYVKYSDLSDRMLLKIIATEDWDLLVTKYRGFPKRKPRKLSSPPPKPKSYFVESEFVSDDWTNIDQLMDVLNSIKDEHGNANLSKVVTCTRSDDYIERGRIKFDTRCDDPYYEKNMKAYAEQLYIYENYDKATREYQSEYFKWIEERLQHFKSLSDSRILYWNDIRHKLRTKKVKARAFEDTLKLKNKNISDEMIGYDIRIKMISLLIDAYEEGQKPWEEYSNGRATPTI